MLFRSTVTTGKVVCWVIGSLLASWLCGSTIGTAIIIASLIVCFGIISGMQKVEVVEWKDKPKASFKTRVDKSKKVTKQQWRKN